MKKKNNHRIIKVPIPKEIWDASMSMCNWNRDVMGAWMRSVEEVVKDTLGRQKGRMFGVVAKGSFLK